MYIKNWFNLLLNLQILMITAVIVTAPFNIIHVHVTILTIIHNNNCCEYYWTPCKEKYNLDNDNLIRP